MLHSISGMHTAMYVYKKITKKLQTRITVTLDHTPDRPKDRTPHVGTYTHTLALLGCEHVPKWGVRSFGRSGVWSSVTVILVCNFLVIFLNAIFFFNIIFFSNFVKAGGGAVPPPHPPAVLLCLFVCLCCSECCRHARGGWMVV